MLVQLTTPRISLDPFKHQHQVYIHTLKKPDVSTGTVLFTGPTDPEHGKQGTVELEPKEVLNLEGDMSVQIYVLPFWKLFQGGPKTVIHDGEEVRSADLKIVRFCTSGFGVVAKSAFRAGPRQYEEHTISFHMTFPATGGGLIRISDSPLDVVNTTFDPWASDPDNLPEAAKNELRSAYARTHALPDGRSDIEARRQARVATAEASMKAEKDRIRAETPTLPDALNKLPPPRCPTCGSSDPKRHPAMQSEGEVQPCLDSWHSSDENPDTA